MPSARERECYALGFVDALKKRDYGSSIGANDAEHDDLIQFNLRAVRRASKRSIWPLGGGRGIARRRRRAQKVEIARGSRVRLGAVRPRVQASLRPPSAAVLAVRVGALAGQRARRTRP